jgi:hypothetical protein
MADWLTRVAQNRIEEATIIVNSLSVGDIKQFMLKTVEAGLIYHSGS